MPTTIAGLFNNRDEATKAITKLKDSGYSDNVSYVAKNLEGDVTKQDVNNDGNTGTEVAAGVGIGALAGALTGAVVAALPAAPLLLAGPLAIGWGVSGAALGGLSGGLVAALVSLGFEEEKAQLFEDRIMAGEVMITVEVDPNKVSEVVSIMEQCGVDDLVQVVEAK